MTTNTANGFSCFGAWLVLGPRGASEESLVSQHLPEVFGTGQSSEVDFVSALFGHGTQRCNGGLTGMSHHQSPSRCRHVTPSTSLQASSSSH
eukprot:2675137-Rhodomonas_salina.1